MSLQTTSGRHRSVRTREHWLRLRSWTRTVAQLRRRLTVRPWPFKAGASFIGELLTPKTRPAVSVVHLERASIGHFPPRPSLVALCLGDEVRVHAFGELYDGATGRIERFVPTKAYPIGIRSTASISARAKGEADGIIWFSADDLELIDRPAERTLAMEAVLADAGSERAW